MANIAVWSAAYDLNRLRFLEVNFFDVGQGDSIFIETPKRWQILIDGGPGSRILEKLAKEMPFWDRTIDLVILTHPEADHLSGLIEVLKKYEVKNILWTGAVRETAEYQEWLKALKEEKARIIIAKAPQRIVISRLVLEILNPIGDWQNKPLKDSNRTSVVSRLVFGNNSFLLTGDIYKEQEEEMILREVNLDSDVLKASHHGSKTSSSREFIKKVSPTAVVIQAGKSNRYGHPHQEVLEILKKFGIMILRTDEQGDIKIISDGNNLKIKTNK